MVYVFLADGFEEIEGLTTVDILRRGNIEVITVGIGKREIVGAHNINVIADILDTEIDYDNLDAVVLPGGMPGATNLAQSKIVAKALMAAAKGKIIAAICAAPTVPAKIGLLKGKKYTCYPGFDTAIDGSYTAGAFEIDKGEFTLVTANGPAAAAAFAFAVLRELKGQAAVDKLKKDMQF